MRARRSPTVRRRRLAAEIRALRHASGKTMTEAAVGAHLTQPTVSRIERAEVRAKPNDVLALATFLGASRAKVEELVTLASELRRKGWWHSYGDTLADRYSNYIEMEEAAVAERTYEPSMIPGLLQTAEYARAISAAILGDAAPVDELAAVRQRRQELLTGTPTPLVLNAIIDEAALRRRYGGAKVMQGQVARLVDMASRPNVTIRVLPIDVDDQPATAGPFVLLDFLDPEPPVVYHEGIRSDVYLEEAADIDCFRMIFTRLEERALTPEDTVKFLTNLVYA